jgi:hypothetical protein
MLRSPFNVVSIWSHIGWQPKEYQRHTEEREIRRKAQYQDRRVDVQQVSNWPAMCGSCVYVCTKSNCYVIEFVFIKLVSKLCLRWELGQGKIMGEFLEASPEPIFKRHSLLNFSNPETWDQSSQVYICICIYICIYIYIYVYIYSCRNFLLFIFSLQVKN